MKRLIGNFFSNMRYNEARRFIVGKSLDVGSGWKRKFFTVCCDLNPRNGVEKQDALSLTYKDDEFESVCCLEVLEHVLDPVKAIRELKRVARSRVIVSVPLEPWFTLPRIFMGWNKEHLWAITPVALKHYLGEPVYEKQLWFRWYFAVFEVEK